MQFALVRLNELMYKRIMTRYCVPPCEVKLQYWFTFHILLIKL